MNEKTIDVRIIQKNDTDTEFLKNDPVLRKGEIVVVDVEETTNTAVAAPYVMIKSGDGVSKYSELEVTYAKALDVYEWAKKSNLEYADLPSVLINKVDTLESNTVDRISNSELEEILK